MPSASCSPSASATWWCSTCGRGTWPAGRTAASTHRFSPRSSATCPASAGPARGSTCASCCGDVPETGAAASPPPVEAYTAELWRRLCLAADDPAGATRVPDLQLSVRGSSVPFGVLGGRGSGFTVSFHSFLGHRSRTGHAPPRAPAGDRSEATAPAGPTAPTRSESILQRAQGKRGRSVIGRADRK